MSHTTAQRIRRPAVAGQFYAGTAGKLKAQIARLEQQLPGQPVAAQGPLLGGVVPHAGYMFSGYHAVPYFQQLAQQNTPPETVVIIAPNHSGRGDALNSAPFDFWETPLGQVPVDTELQQLLELPAHEPAHAHEHAAEVMLPFLQYYLPPDVHIVPIVFLDQNPQQARQLADKLLAASRQLNRRINVIASSDFSHFLPPDQGKALDELALEQIHKKNSRGLAQVVKKHDITLCGYGPIMALMDYARALSPDYLSQVLSRGSSGDVMPSQSVVDYVCIAFYQ